MIFEALAELGYGELHVARDAPSGLRALVAIHSTRLGPAIGGCRIRAYPNENGAIHDVTRLARAMSLKAALAGLPCGGGKAVICAPPDIDVPGFDREALLAAFGRFVDGLGGRYLTCEDSGSSAADMDIVRRSTRHVLGTSIEQGGSGDPSPFTALGVRRGIEAVAQVVLGRSDLRGLHVLVQGVGHVGANLARELSRCGARLTITDVDAARRAQVAAETGAAQVEPEAIFDVACDVLSPCAMGGVISRTSVGRLRCRAVAGAANNQLETPSVGRTLHERGVFYAPDYAINAGGLINVAQELAGYDAEAVRGKVTRIYDTIAEIAERSRRLDRPPSEIADGLATELMARGPGTSGGSSDRESRGEGSSG